MFLFRFSRRIISFPYLLRMTYLSFVVLAVSCNEIEIKMVIYNGCKSLVRKVNVAVFVE